MRGARSVKSATVTRKRSQYFWLKMATLILATVLSLLGSAGQFFFIETYDDVISARTSEMRQIESRASTLRSTQAEFFNAYVQANMLFAMNPSDVKVNKGVTAQMYQLAIIDRAFPFRAILGEMAMAGLFEFKATNDQYKALADAARADLGYESYNALIAFEKDILDRALTLQHNLQDRFFVAQEERALAEDERDKRRLWLTLMTAVGTILLLAANLMEETKKAAK